MKYHNIKGPTCLILDVLLSRYSRREAMVAAKTSTSSKAAIIYDMSVASIFGKEYINTIAILGGVIGFWGGIFVLGIIYLILVCIRRLRKHSTTESSGGAVVNHHHSHRQHCH